VGESVDAPAGQPRNIVLCLDGTSNEPEAGTTNVVRMFQAAAKSVDQVVFYHPGVGTMGARGAVTRVGRAVSRIAGMVVGFGIKDNIETAYSFLLRTWQPGDRVFVFGFSRGAYTARALTGMLATVGLLRPEAENLVPYAMKLYAKKVPDGDSEAAKKRRQAFWKQRRDFVAQFGQPGFPDVFDTSAHQVHFLGVWDTVKTVGWLNWRAQFQQVRWPYTTDVRNVEHARHALALDERRKPFREHRLSGEAVASSDGRYKQVWFAGIHSDVGGQFLDDHRLSDIAFDWMVQEAAEKGLLVDERAYRRLLGISWGAPLPADLALGAIHRNPWVWALLGGWRHRPVRQGDDVHASARHRQRATAELANPYRPDLG
jgi:uncharacterized protein (DUF2235 family)